MEIDLCCPNRWLAYFCLWRKYVRNQHFLKMVVLTEAIAVVPLGLWKERPFKNGSSVYSWISNTTDRTFISIRVARSQDLDRMKKYIKKRVCGGSKWTWMPTTFTGFLVYRWNGFTPFAGAPASSSIVSQRNKRVIHYYPAVQETQRWYALRGLHQC